MIHIPNKTGAAGMINDLVVGDAQAAFLNVASSAAAMIKAGKLRPLARGRRAARCRIIPTCRRMAEAGYPGVGTLHWQSMLAPAGTPKDGAGDDLQGDRSRRCEGRRRSGGVRQADLSASSRTSRSTRRRPGSKSELETWRKTSPREVKIEAAE